MVGEGGAFVFIEIVLVNIHTFLKPLFDMVYFEVSNPNSRSFKRDKSSALGKIKDSRL